MEISIRGPGFSYLGTASLRLVDMEIYEARKMPSSRVVVATSKAWAELQMVWTNACMLLAKSYDKDADFIKIMVSGGVVSQTDRLTSLQYTPEEIRAFTRVASDSGTTLPLMRTRQPQSRMPVSNGVMGIEHGNLIDEPTAKLMAEKGAFLTPTLIHMRPCASKEFRLLLPPSIASKNLQVLDAGLKSIQIADAAGVTMCYGTDLLGPLQVKQTGEFTLRKKAGLGNFKILQAATVNAARMLRKEDTLGRLKEGFSADLIVLNANPLEDIEVLDRPEQHLLAVVKEGRVLESRWSKMPSELEEVSVIE